MKKYIWAVCYGLALTAFTAYISLDTFVLTSSYQSDATQMNTSMFADSSVSQSENSVAAADDSSETENKTDNENTESADAETYQKHSGKHDHSGNDGTENDDTDDSSTSENAASAESSSYEDDNIKITLTEYYENNTKIYVADIQLTSAEYLKTAFANDTYGKNVTAKTSAIASAHNAILAVNGDYYGTQERGYVIRNGIVYRDTASDNDLLCIYANGTMAVLDQSEYTADELVEQGVWQAFSFGPGLVENGGGNTFSESLCFCCG